MDNRNYWQNRFLQLKSNELDNVKDYEQALFKRMNGLQAQMDKELKYWFNRYESNNGLPPDTAKKLFDSIKTSNWENTLEQFKQKAIEGGYERELNNEYFKSQIARLGQLEDQLKEHSSRFAGDESDKMKDSLANQYKDTYMRNNYTIQQYKGKFSNDFAKFDKNQLRIAVSEPWKAENFSDRIWKNYRDELPSQLMDSIARSTLTGRNYAQTSKDFQERFQGVKTKNVHRLVITEMGHTTENATAKSYEENDVQKYEYLATLEARTCPVCRNLDGKVFTFSKRVEGTNYPLIHPYCRCTTVPYVPKTEQAGVRLDDENKQNVQNMNYNQWTKHINAGTLDKYKVDDTNPVKPTTKSQSPKKPSDPFERFRPKPDKSIDFDKATNQEIRKYITNNFGMEIREGNTPTKQLGEYGLRNVAETLGQFKELYNALPQKIPSLRAQNGTQMRRAIASYEFMPSSDNAPIGLNINTKFFRGGKSALQKTIDSGIKSGWFSKNSNSNHVIMHEFSHHLDMQLSSLKGQTLSNDVFNRLSKETNYKNEDLTQYGAQFYNMDGGKNRHVELFAEMFTEAYGDTPRPIALKFKRIFEEEAKEALKNANKT